MNTVITEQIYIDYASSAPLDERVHEVMNSVFVMPGNASALHSSHGQFLKNKVKQAKQYIADAINAKPNEIILTSGATEANNLALLGLRSYLCDKDMNEIVSSETEHSSVLQPLKILKNAGLNVRYAPVKNCGMADSPDVLNTITEQTGLISLQLVNNETGTINPIDEVSEGIKGKGILLHCDASQALGKIRIDVQALGVDMLSISAHKAYGPQGIGALYVAENTQKLLSPIIHGGGHQDNLRSGTLPAALIAGFGEACRIICEEQNSDYQHVLELYRTMRSIFDDAGLNYRINGHDLYKYNTEQGFLWRVPHIMNICFKDVPHELLLSCVAGVSFSVASACQINGTSNLSHVLTAMRKSEEHINQSVRLSFGRFTTLEEVQKAAQILVEAVQALTEITQTDSERSVA